MIRPSYIFTSESVSEGHPDKVADRISDTVVDAFLAADPEARVACETMVTTNRIILGGEIRATKAGADKAGNKAFTKEILGTLEDKVRAAVKDIGYEQKGFHWKKAKFANYLHAQSAHIAQGVDASEKKDEGAGDQGIMFGYASNETPELMPATLQWSHDILRVLAEKRKSGELGELQPDAKSQVTLQYENGKPVSVLKVLVSHQHNKKISAATSPRTWSPRAWPSAAPSRLPMPSAWPSRSASTSTCTAPGTSTRRCWKRPCRRWSAAPRAPSASGSASMRPSTPARRPTATSAAPRTTRAASAGNGRTWSTSSSPWPSRRCVVRDAADAAPHHDGSLWSPNSLVMLRRTQSRRLEARTEVDYPPTTDSFGLVSRGSSRTSHLCVKSRIFG